MYDMRSRTVVCTVIVDEAVINGTAKPTYKAERLPQVTTPELVEKKDLKVIDSKSA